MAALVALSVRAIKPWRARVAGDTTDTERLVDMARVNALTVLPSAVSERDVVRTIDVTVLPVAAASLPGSLSMDDNAVTELLYIRTITLNWTCVANGAVVLNRAVATALYAVAGATNALAKALLIDLIKLVTAATELGSVLARLLAKALVAADTALSVRAITLCRANVATGALVPNRSTDIARNILVGAATALDMVRLVERTNDVTADTADKAFLVRIFT